MPLSNNADILKSRNFLIVHFYLLTNKIHQLNEIQKDGTPYIEVIDYFTTATFSKHKLLNYKSSSYMQKRTTSGQLRYKSLSTLFLAYQRK